MKRLGIALFTAVVTSFAHAADLPTTKPADATPDKPPCFSSLWNYLKSSVRDCPLSVGPLTLYGTLDGGFGYEQWGTHVGTYPRTSPITPSRETAAIRTGSGRRTG